MQVTQEVSDAYVFSMGTLRTMRDMRECLPDGMWEEVQELIADIKDANLRPLDEEWLEIQADILRIQAEWA